MAAIPLNAEQKVLYDEAKASLDKGMVHLCEDESEAERFRLYEICSELDKSLKKSGLAIKPTKSMHENRMDEKKRDGDGFFEHLHPCEDLIDFITLGRYPTQKERFAKHKSQNK